MGKYNVNINMSNRNCSHTLILEQIKPCSMVLEMGCATGYMTKYMKERLECDVDVVEMDCDALSIASQYAHDKYLGDLDSWTWAEHYKNNRYDYILFADVLEHLKYPSETLQMAVQLLKKDGNIIISIPNICHNDIIIQLFNDHFRYTDLGLLDSTHIHFWGKEDFRLFCEKVGLNVISTRKVMFPTQGTEQRLDSRANAELISLLRKREYGEVYQWIFTCEKR